MTKLIQCCGICWWGFFLLIGQNASAMANLIANGDFENGTNGWAIAIGVEAGAVLATNTAAQSPFSTGSAGFQMTDGSVNASQNIINDFGAQADGQYELSFDYMMLAANNSIWLGAARSYTNGDSRGQFRCGYR